MSCCPILCHVANDSAAGVARPTEGRKSDTSGSNSGGLITQLVLATLPRAVSPTLAAVMLLLLAAQLVLAALLRAESPTLAAVMLLLLAAQLVLAALLRAVSRTLAAVMLLLLVALLVLAALPRATSPASGPLATRVKNPASRVRSPAMLRPWHTQTPVTLMSSPLRVQPEETAPGTTLLLLLHPSLAGW